MCFHGITKSFLLFAWAKKNTLREAILDVQYIIYLASYAVTA